MSAEDIGKQGNYRGVPVRVVAEPLALKHLHWSLFGSASAAARVLGVTRSCVLTALTGDGYLLKVGVTIASPERVEAVIAARRAGKALTGRTGWGRPADA